MNATNRFLIPVLALSAVALPACGANLEFVFGEEGSGVAETTSYDFESFDGVEIGSAFEAEIQLVDGPPTVEITVDDNFTDELEVEVDNGVLRVGIDLNSYQAKVDHIAVITVPSLDLIDASGAASVTVDGVVEDANLEIVGSGASDVMADIDANALTVNASGASSVALSGTADRLVLDASGASDVDLNDLVVSTATVDASGASSVSIGEADDIDGTLSGASSLDAPDEAIDDIDTSGASSIDRN